MHGIRASLQSKGRMAGCAWPSTTATFIGIQKRPSAKGCARARRAHRAHAPPPALAVPALPAEHAGPRQPGLSPTDSRLRRRAAFNAARAASVAIADAATSTSSRHVRAGKSFRR